MSEPTDADATGSRAPEIVATPAEVATDDCLVEEPESYAVEEQIGVGGMGTVLAAKGARFGRPVAIKVVTADRDDLRRRFEREARVTARLQHPAIVPVYGSGHGRAGRPFYVMKRVTGEPLDKVIAKTTTVDERIALLPKVIAVAEAIAYAHAQRVIHRDLKPANILVGEFGETVVIDWGLAKDLSASDGDEADAPATSPYRAGAEHTVAGKVMGTPAYMPREQAQGERVDERADVYALGAILYHLLAGTPPFARPGEGSVAWESMLARVLSGPPSPLKTHQPNLPPDLLAIVERAMATSADARYASAGELATDLRRFQTGQLVGVHRYSTWQLVRRWIRRHRGAVGVGAASLVVVAVIGAIAVVNVVRERDTAQAARADAEARNNDLTVAQARNALPSDPTAALAWLAELAPDAPGWDAARIVGADARARGVARHVLQHDGGVHSAAFASGDRLVTLDGGAAYVWQLGAEPVLSRRSIGEPLALAPDGRHAVVAGKLWDTAAGTSRALDLPPVLIRVAFSADGHTVAALGRGSLRVWNADSGVSRATAQVDDRLRTIAVTPDAVVMAGSNVRDVLVVFDLARGAARVVLDDPHPYDTSVDPPLAVAGGIIAVARLPNNPRVFEIATGTERPIQHLVDEPATIALSSDGRWLAVGGTSGELEVDDTVRGATVDIHTDKHEPVRAIALSPDAKTVAAAGGDGSVRLLDWNSRRIRTLLGHVHAVDAVAFSPDGKWIATAGADHAARVWPGAVDDVRRVTLATTSELVRWLPDGSFLVREGGMPLGDDQFEPESLRVWSSEREHVVADSPGALGAIAVTRDGRFAAVLGRDKTMRRCEIATARCTMLAPVPEDAELPDTVVIAPDGAWIAGLSSVGDPVFRVWSADGAAPKLVTADYDTLAAPVLSPDGRTLAAASLDHAIRLWDTSTWSARALVGDSARVHVLAWSMDGSRLASGSDDGSVRVWDVAAATGRVAGKHDSPVWALAFSPDGVTLASGGEDGAIHLWDTTRGVRVLTGTGIVSALAFSPDGRTLAANHDSARVQLWDVRLAEGHGTGGTMHVHDPQFSPDGRSIATSCGGVCLIDNGTPADPTAMRAWIVTQTSARLGRDRRPSTPATGGAR